MEVLISIFVSIFPMFIFGLIIFLVIRKHIKEMKLKTEEFKKIPSTRVELYDLLHILRRGRKNSKSEFIAVYKDLATNQLYVAGRKSYLANPLIAYTHFIGNAPKIVVRSHNQKQIEPTAKGDLHISTRLGSVISESNMITLDGIRYEYKGSVHELTSLNAKPQPEIRNSVENNRIIEELNNATVIDGLIEFDIDKF